MRVFSSACVRGSVPFLAGEGPGLTRLLTPAGGNLRAAVVLLFLRRMISAPFCVEEQERTSLELLLCCWADRQ